MKITKWLIVMIVVLVAHSASSQPRAEISPIYLLVRDDDQSAVLALDPVTGQETVLFSLNEEILATEVLPEDELALLRQYLSVNFNSSDLETTILYSYVTDLVVSARGDKLLLQVSYDRCIPPNSRECYGTTQLVVIDTKTQQSEVIFNLGYHNTQYKDVPFLSTNQHPETQLINASWLPDQTAILIGVTYNFLRRNLHNYSIVFVPLNGNAPLVIGKGVSWVSSPNATQLTVVSLPDDPQAYYSNILKIIDLDSQILTSTPYVINEKFLSSFDALAYTENGILFQILFDMRGAEASGGGLSYFDLTTRTWSVLMPEETFQQFETYQDQIFMLNAEDQRLYSAIVTGETVSLTLLVSLPIADYALSQTTGQLLVRYVDNGAYEILDLDGNLLQAVTFESPRTAGSSERSILKVDF